MQFTTKTRDLKTAIEKLSLLTAKPAQPALALIRFGCADEKLALSAADQYNFAELSLPVQQREAGAVALVGAKLKVALQSFTSESIEVIREDKSVLFRAGKTRTKLLYNDPSQCMSRPDENTLVLCRRPGAVLRRIIEIASPVLADRSSNYSLDQIWLRVKAGRLEALASDGHVSNKVSTDADRKRESDTSIPRLAIPLMLNLLPDADVSVLSNAGKTVFTAPGLYLAIGRADAQFPRLDDVYADYEWDNPTTVQVGKDAAVAVIGHSLNFNDSDTRFALLRGDGEEISISTINSQGETLDDSFAASDWKGKIKINTRLTRTALSKSQAQIITMRWKETEREFNDIQQVLATVSVAATEKVGEAEIELLSVFAGLHVEKEG